MSLLCFDIECSMPGCQYMTNICFALPGTTCLSGWKLPCMLLAQKHALEVLGNWDKPKGGSLGFSCFGRFLIRKCPSRKLKITPSPIFSTSLCRTLPPNRPQQHTGLRITGTSTRRTTSTSGITFSLGRNCSPLNSRSFQHVPCHHSGAQ